VAARQIVKVWRESYNIFAVQGYLFNHESERRGEEFVTRKITKSVARIATSISEGNTDFEPLELGNMNAKRDWSHAEDFVRAVWLMLNEETPKDYLLASGETHTVKEFVEMAFENAGIKGFWSGEGENEKFKFLGEVPVDMTLVKVNPDFYRPAEVDLLLGDPSEAQKDLNWEKSVDFPSLVRRMTLNDLKEINAT
jgi:GDPmannose 4,6-dehydratase